MTAARSCVRRCRPGRRRPASRCGGAQCIAEADIVIWAASLVHEDVLAARPAGRRDRRLRRRCRWRASVALYERAAREGLRVARIHSGDPALWGAVAGAARAVRRARAGRSRSSPGSPRSAPSPRSSQRELTDPRGRAVASSSPGWTAARPRCRPARAVREFARHGTTMALFLSAARSGQLAGGAAGRRLRRGHARASSPTGRPGRTSCVVRCTVGDAGGDGQGAQAVEAHAVPGRPGPRRRAAPARTSTTPATSTGTAGPSRRAGARRRAARGAAMTSVAGSRPTEPAQTLPTSPSRTCRAPRRSAPGALRTGWTTGTCAAPRPRPRRCCWATGEPQDDVEVAAARAGSRVTVRRRALRAATTARRRGGRGQGRRRRPRRHPRRPPDRDRRVGDRAPAWSCAAAPASARSPSPASGLRRRRPGDQPGAAGDDHRTRSREVIDRPRRAWWSSASPRASGWPARRPTPGSASSAASRSSARPGSSGRSRPRVWRASVVQAVRRDGARRASRPWCCAPAAAPRRRAMRLLPDLPEVLLRRGRRLHRRRAAHGRRAPALRRLRLRRHGRQAHQAGRRRADDPLHPQSKVDVGLLGDVTRVAAAPARAALAAAVDAANTGPARLRAVGAAGVLRRGRGRAVPPGPGGARSASPPARSPWTWRWSTSPGSACVAATRSGWAA